MGERHVFRGHWIQNPRFYGLEPIDVFHKEHTPKEIPPVPEETLNNHTWFIRRFTLPAGTKDLRIDISADDYARVYLNGSLLGLGPAQAYAEDYQFNTYRIREGLVIGENILAVHVYYQGLINRAYQSGDNREGMVADVFADGNFLFGSDSSFLFREAEEYVTGARTGYDTTFLENIDMTKSAGNGALGEGTGWQPACVCEEMPYRFRELPDPGLDITEKLPVLTSNVGGDPRVLFMDFGSEIVGNLRLRIQGVVGTSVRVLCGEELDDHDYTMPRYKMRCNCNYEEICTLSGRPDDIPFFDGKGFRYARIELPEGAEWLNRGAFAEVRTRAGAHPRIRFETDDRDLEAVLRLCENTLLTAVGDSFPDCPQREKGQYLGDFTFTGLAYLYLTGDWFSYKKALRDFADSAKVCPGLLAVAPGSFMQEIADYSLQFPLQVWNGYRFSKDRAMLREYLPVIEGILRHFKQFERSDGLLAGVTDKWNLVDWPANLRDHYDVPLPKPMPPDGIHNVINAFWIGAHIVTNRIRAELELPETSDIRRRVQAFNSLFYDETRHLYTDGPDTAHASLHANVLPVFYGFARQDSLEAIHELIKEKGMCCGLYFAYFVLKACALLHDYDLVLSLITRKGEYGWMHMLEQDASTTFEAWGKEQKHNTSLCHPCGAIPIIAAVESLAPNRPDLIRVVPVRK